jgi:hypothetical protein
MTSHTLLVDKINTAINFLRTVSDHPASGVLFDEIENSVGELAQLVTHEAPATTTTSSSGSSEPHLSSSSEPHLSSSFSSSSHKRVKREPDTPAALSPAERSSTSAPAPAPAPSPAPAAFSHPPAFPFDGTLTVSEVIQAHRFLHAPDTARSDLFLTQYEYGGTKMHGCGWAKNNTPDAAPYKIKVGEYTIQTQNRTKNTAFADRAKAGICVTWVWLGGFSGNTCRVIESDTWNSAPRWTKAYTKPVLANDLSASMVQGPLWYA